MADDDDAAAKRRQGRRSTGIGPMGGMSALPEHLQVDIFSRVGDVKALFRFAATCRGWLRRFTDEAFLRELCPNPHGGSGSGHRARLLGVLVQDKWFNPWNKTMMTTAMAAAAPPSSSAPVFLPALGSPLGPAGRARALTSFISGGGGDDGTFDYADLLAARRGIVLLQLAPRTRPPEEINSISSYHLLAVCNPVTGDRHILPPLECSPVAAGCRLEGYAIITGDDDPPPAAAAAVRWTFSRLLVITRDDGEGPRRDEVVIGASYLHTYSAATRSWSGPTTCADGVVFSLVGARSGVVHRGKAHWLCIDDGRLPYERVGEVDHHLFRLSVDVDHVATAHGGVSFTRLPVRFGGEQLLFVNPGDGKLAVASVYPIHVTVWTPPPPAGAGDDTTTPVTWPRTSFRIDAQQHHTESWFNFNHGSLLALFKGSGGGRHARPRHQDDGGSLHRRHGQQVHGLPGCIWGKGVSDVCAL